MRPGFSTSACAAAAAVTGISALEKDCLNTVEEVTIHLPSGIQAVFVLRTLHRTDEGVLCGVIKDAGDDPDVTNGIEIQTLVRRNGLTENRILGGRGVGIVTLPGLPVGVGKPAINPGSQKLIHTILNRFLKQEAIPPGFDITIIVPEGEQIALQTLNPKLGIQGGISILGTDGMVHPYSAPAFRASVYTEMKVAAKNGYTGVAIATGKRSAEFLERELRADDRVYVINAGDELEFPLALVSRFPFSTVILSGMIGKMTKVAQGRFRTHVEHGRVDFDFLSDLASSNNVPPEICENIRTANTAHQVQFWLSKINVRLEPDIARLAAYETQKKIGANYAVAVYIFSLKGELLGQCKIEPNE